MSISETQQKRKENTKKQQRKNVNSQTEQQIRKGLTIRFPMRFKGHVNDYVTNEKCCTLFPFCVHTFFVVQHWSTTIEKTLKSSVYGLL